MLAIGTTGLPGEFTHDIRNAMSSSGFADTSPGGCITWPIYFCWDPVAYPQDGEGASSASVVTAGFTFRSGLHVGAVYEHRQLGGTVGWNAQAGRLNIAAKETNLAVVAGFERRLSGGDDAVGRVHGRVAAGPVVSSVNVVASGSGADGSTSTARAGLMLEAGLSCRIRSIFVVDLALQRWQLGRLDVGPYTVTSGSVSQVFAPAKAELSHTGAYVSIGVRP